MESDHNTSTKECDICLTSHSTTKLLSWDCGLCNWCFECITTGITSAPRKSDWPQNWCGHPTPLPIPLVVILLKSKPHIDVAIYEKWDDRLREWSSVHCPYCSRTTYPDHLNGSALVCPNCGMSICVECQKQVHSGACQRTSRKDPRAVLQALQKEGATMCPARKPIPVRDKEGCNRFVCSKPCDQNLCFGCSRDWEECKGLCKGNAAAEVPGKEAQPDDDQRSTGSLEMLLLEPKEEMSKELKLRGQQELKGKKSKTIAEDADSCASLINQALLNDNTTHATFLEIKDEVRKFNGKSEEEDEYSDDWRRKRARSPDYLSATLKKVKTEEMVGDEEEDLSDVDAELEASLITALEDEDANIHDDEEEDEDLQIIVDGDGEADDDDEEDDYEYGDQRDGDEMEDGWPNY